MFSFTKNQTIYDVSSVRIGGQPGENPTVLFGGLFFKGPLDFTKTKKSLDEFLNFSDITGVPGIPDFFIKNEDQIIPIINFIENNLPKNIPFSIDIIDPIIKIKVLEILYKKNLLSRTIYNSIHIGLKENEIEALKKYTPEMAILVAFNPKDKSPDGKIEVLENGANFIENGLIEISEKIGIKKILLDSAALAPGDNSGAAIAAIPVIKEEFGLPTGCAIHNVVEKSRWLEKSNFDKKIVDAASNINIPLFGGDFAIFGSIDISELVFPIIAWEDILISEYTDNYFDVNPSNLHPRRKLY